MFKKTLALVLNLVLFLNIAWASPNLVQTQSLQNVTEVGATTTKMITIDVPVAGMTALDIDATSLAGTSVTQVWRIDGVTQCTYGLFLGAFTGFVQPNVGGNIFFGIGDASAYVLVGSGAVTIGGNLVAGATTVGSLTNSSLTSGQVVFAGASGLNQGDADLTFLTDTLSVTKVQVKAGAAAGTTAKVGGSIFDHFTDVGNVGTGDDDLYSDTLAASTFGTNGDKIAGVYSGTFVGDATSTQRLRAYLGGTLIFDTGALGIGVTPANWKLDVDCIRVSSSVVRCGSALSTSFATLSSYASYVEVTALTLTNTQILKITGEAAGVTAANNQIIAKFSNVQFRPAS